MDQFEGQEAVVFDLGASTDTSTDVYFLHQALAQLSDEQRESIILFEISGFSIKEISKIQETSESSVKQRLRRGRIRLKEILTFVALPNEDNETSSEENNSNKTSYAKAMDVKKGEGQL